MFYLVARAQSDDDPWLWRCSTSRHWNLDREDPR
jgi:hypothetical protein